MPASLRIDRLDPAAVLPGGEVRVHGQALNDHALSQVRVGGTAAALVIGTPRLLVARVAEGTDSGPVEVQSASGEEATSRQELRVGVLISENLHPVCSPVLDAEGNIYATLSGSRGQKTPVSLFKVDTNFTVKPWSSAIINPSGLAFDHEGVLHCSSRHAGAVYRLAANGSSTLLAEGLGIATGIAFDAAGDLFVGDRSGTIFKIDRRHNTFVFATLEPSVAAYHLAFGPDGHLFVAGPSTSSHDTIWRISPKGEVAPFFKGLGRPQGIAFDLAGNLHVVASHAGRRGVIRISPQGEAECVVSANNLVGLAFAAGARGGPHHAALILASHTSLYHLGWPVPGLPLPPAGP
ncbi:MAG TPA: gluconolaconase [Terriglobales bacterium]|nr:gluconolaconase [Terriglobales bacterium]